MQISEEGGLLNHSDAAEYWGRRLIDFDLEYTSEPAKQFDHLINQITDEIEKPEDRERNRGDGARKELRQCVRAIVLNFAYMPHMFKACDTVYLVVARGKDNFGKGNYRLFEGVSPAQFKAAYDGLISDELGYTTIHQKPYQSVRRTSIGATEKLIALIQEVEDKCESIQFHPSKAALTKNRIYLRNDKKRDILYIETSQTKRMQTNLRKINRLLCDADIRFSAQLTPKVHDELVEHLERRDINYIDQTRVLLKRVFNLERFDLGGRFYSGWWQSVPEGFRHYIQINGQDTVELDYSEMHPTMVYAEAGANKPENSYIPMPELLQRIEEKVLRDCGKLAFNMLLNADTKTPYQPDDYKVVKDITGIKWKDFLDAMYEHHPLIKDKYFRSGVGRRLQYIDSQIAEKILLHFVDIGVPCLPIHDSFIVPVDHEEELHSVMDRYAEEIAGVAIAIKKKG